MICPECGEAMSYKGKPSREVIHQEGEEELAKVYGGKVVEQQAVEAETMVKPPAGDDIIVPRDMPQPESEVMAVSRDGAMVNHKSTRRCAVR